MTKDELNTIPSKIKDGSISAKDALTKVLEFVFSNYRMFGLQKYDEDLRSEVFTNFLEKGVHIFELYDSESSSFSTYLYIYVDSILKYIIKKNIKKCEQDHFDYIEGITEYEEKSVAYIPEINNKQQEAKTSGKNSDLKQLFNTRNCLTTNQKALIILTLRSAYYITDFHIKRICKYINFDEKIFATIIQKLKNDIISSEKTTRRLSYVERRNKAYVYHKQYTTQEDKLKRFSETPKNYQLNLSSKNQRYTNNWEQLNKKFSEGFMMLRPSANVLSEVVGLCPRQVNYYISVSLRLDESVINEVLLDDIDK